jgi:hypothetical protein
MSQEQRDAFVAGAAWASAKIEWDGDVDDESLNAEAFSCYPDQDDNAKPGQQTDDMPLAHPPEAARRDAWEEADEALAKQLYTQFVTLGAPIPIDRTMKWEDFPGKDYYREKARYIRRLPNEVVEDGSVEK